MIAYINGTSLYEDRHIVPDNQPGEGSKVVKVILNQGPELQTLSEERLCRLWKAVFNQKDHKNQIGFSEGNVLNFRSDGLSAILSQ